MSSQAVPTHRYGAPAPWRRRALIVACVVVALAFGGWLAWTTASHSTPDVESELIGSDDVVATCLLRAVAEDHSVVGELSFTAEPEQGTRYEQTVRTERLATSVDLVGCTTPDQPRPR